jgi:hypothetical protein
MRRDAASLAVTVCERFDQHNVVGSHPRPDHSLVAADLKHLRHNG